MRTAAANTAILEATVTLPEPEPRRMSRAQFERKRRGINAQRAAGLIHVDTARLSLLEHRRPMGARLLRLAAKLYGLPNTMDLYDEVSVSLVEVRPAKPWIEIENQNEETETLESSDEGGSA